MILDYVNPVKVYQTLNACVEDLFNFSKYKEIILQLQKEGKLEAIGFSLDKVGNLYLGINLNPEMLFYSETSQTTVELKMISEKMLKYNDFLTKEGIIDYIKVDYDRVKTDEHYGYILQISYNFRKYNRKSFIYAIGYFLTIFSSLIAIVISLIS